MVQHKHRIIKTRRPGLSRSQSSARSGNGDPKGEYHADNGNGLDLTEARRTRGTATRQVTVETVKGKSGSVRALERRGLGVERQVGIAIEYQGTKFDEGFRADLIIEGKVIVELKSLERVTPAHKKQLLTYLRLTGVKLGYLLNFSEALMRKGITRTINGCLDSEPPCLGASVREKFIESGGVAQAVPPHQ